MSSQAPLSHTYSPRAIAEVSLNGTVVGESGINALVAQAFGVPIVLITGDDVTAAEARNVIPGIHAAVVKTAITRFAADSLHPHAACELIRDAARLAVAGLGGATPPANTLPATLDVTYRNADIAEASTWVSGVVRTGPTTVAITDDDPLKVFRRFITTVLLTRDIAE
jgi:D-amino peptidase